MFRQEKFLERVAAIVLQFIRRVVVRVSIELPEEDIAVVKKIAKKYGVTGTAAIRKAIADEKFFLNEVENGAQILLKRGDVYREVSLKQEKR